MNLKNQLGRDPACGRVAFKTGAILTKKDRERNRRSKEYKRNLQRQLEGKE